jgi:hypothetical protein
MRGSALLAIWSDVAPESETDYLHWLTREHVVERLSTEGFVAVRVFRAENVEARRYLIIYELESVDALDGPDYLRKLNNPTPWSQRIMPTLQNFVRGGGPIVARAGTGKGSFLLPITVDSIPADGRAIVEALAREDRVCSVVLMRTDQARTGVETLEKTMRRKDESFAGLLLIDALDASVATSAGAASLLPDGERPRGLYWQVFHRER